MADNFNMVNFANKLLAGPPAPCSWCLKEMNLKPQQGSHGICKRHRAIETERFNTWMAVNAVEDAMALTRRES